MTIQGEGQEDGDETEVRNIHIARAGGDCVDSNKASQGRHEYSGQKVRRLLLLNVSAGAKEKLC